MVSPVPPLSFFELDYSHCLIGLYYGGNSPTQKLLSNLDNRSAAFLKLYWTGEGIAYGVRRIGHSPFGPSVLSASACEHAPALIFDKGW